MGKGEVAARIVVGVVGVIPIAASVFVALETGAWLREREETCAVSAQDSSQIANYCAKRLYNDEVIDAKVDSALAILALGGACIGYTAVFGGRSYSQAAAPTERPNFGGV